jgi:hypothetical protein
MIRRRIGLFLFGLLGIMENTVNLVLYTTFLDLLIGPVDLQLPVYGWYSNKFLKSAYLKDIGHGKDV